MSKRYRSQSSKEFPKQPRPNPEHAVANDLCLDARQRDLTPTPMSSTDVDTLQSDIPNRKGKVASDLWPLLPAGRKGHFDQIDLQGPEAQTIKPSQPFFGGFFCTFRPVGFLIVNLRARAVVHPTETGKWPTHRMHVPREFGQYGACSLRSFVRVAWQSWGQESRSMANGWSTCAFVSRSCSIINASCQFAVPKIISTESTNMVSYMVPVQGSRPRNAHVRRQVKV